MYECCEGETAKSGERMKAKEEEKEEDGEHANYEQPVRASLLLWFSHDDDGNHGDDDRAVDHRESMRSVCW